MRVLVVFHAVAASLSLILGAVNLLRRRKGDPFHRLIGRVWVVAMYTTIVTSFFVRELRPGHFSWIHGLSLFTLVTLTLALWAARTGRIGVHQRSMIGTYLGAVGAFIGAVVVPQRAIPQLVVHHPWLLSVGAFAVLGLAGAVVAAARRFGDRAATLDRVG